MNRSRQIIAVFFALLVTAGLWMAFGPSDFAGAEQANDADLQTHIEQAANSVIAAAKQSVEEATSDEEAAQKMQAAIEALRMIGMLGSVDMGAQSAQLMDDLQSVAPPAVVEEIIKIRLSQQLQGWNNSDTTARNAAIDRLIADVKQAGMSPELADLIMRLGDRLEYAGEYELATRAINGLLPAFRDSSDPKVQRRAPLLEGVVRRLPGNKMELAGTLLDGQTLDWDAYRGKVVLVDFFASWCGPCRAEVPNVLENYLDYRDKGFEVIGVSMDDERGAAEKYVKQAGIEFPVLFSDDAQATGWDHPMGRKYGVMALPRVILVDQDGVIVSTMARGPNLRSLLQELLGEPAPAADQTSDAATADAEVAPASFEEETAPAAVPEE